MFSENFGLFGLHNNANKFLKVSFCFVFGVCLFVSTGPHPIEATSTERGQRATAALGDAEAGTTPGTSL